MSPFKTGIELHILYNCNIDYSLPEAPVLYCDNSELLVEKYMITTGRHGDEKRIYSGRGDNHAVGDDAAVYQAIAEWVKQCKNRIYQFDDCLYFYGRPEPGMRKFKTVSAI